MRHDGRSEHQLRPVKITPNFLNHPPGSCLIEMGNTRVLCSVMVENSVPPWLKGQGSGWLTAEYAMLPASSSSRIGRERGKVGGRTQEIQRLIGRSLRSCMDLKKMGEVSLLVDCDVLDADGGTRTAAITGSYVALRLAIHNLRETHPSLSLAVKGAVAAVSVGLVAGKPVLDLDYPEDKLAEVDMNIVQTDQGRFVELQGTGESGDFDKNQLGALIKLGESGIAELLRIQQKVLEQCGS